MGLVNKNVANLTVKLEEILSERNKVLVINLGIFVAMVCIVIFDEFTEFNSNHSPNIADISKLEKVFF
jgi:hypothetical protein